jgi:hypothetical protein
MSSLLQNILDLFYRPSLSLRTYANTSSVIGIDERMRGDLIVYLEQAQFGRRQPCKCVVYVTGENLPRRPIVQFDAVAFGMLHDFHAMACREHNEQKTAMRGRVLSASRCNAAKPGARVGEGG